MLSVNFVCNISSYDILAYITKNYIALICVLPWQQLPKNSNMNNNVGGDYDRLTDWNRPLERGLAIYSLTDS
jgi:hypothetical protein